MKPVTGQRTLGNPRPFQKGQSGNPTGRPKKLPVTQVLAKQLDEGTATQLAEVISNALAGQQWAVQFIADRLEGKAIAREEHGNPGDFEVSLEEARKVLRVVGGRSK